MLQDDITISLIDEVPLHDLMTTDLCPPALTTPINEDVDRLSDLPQPILWAGHVACQYLRLSSLDVYNSCTYNAIYKLPCGKLLCNFHSREHKGNRTKLPTGLPNISLNDYLTPEQHDKTIRDNMAWFSQIGLEGHVRWMNIQKKKRIPLLPTYRNIAIDLTFQRKKRQRLTLLPFASICTIGPIRVGVMRHASSIHNVIQGSLYYGQSIRKIREGDLVLRRAFLENRRAMCLNSHVVNENPLAYTTSHTKVAPTAFIWENMNGTLTIYKPHMARGFACKMMSDYLQTKDNNEFLSLKKEINNGLSVNICGYNLHNIPCYSEDIDGMMLQECYDNSEFNFSSEVVFYVMLTYPPQLWPWRTIVVD